MSDKKISRKDFLTYSAALGVSGILGTSLLSSCGGKKFVPLKQPGEYYVPELPDTAVAGKELKVGVVGCGGRGSGAVMDLLDAADGIKIVALGDTFRDRVDGLRNDIREKRGQEVPAENCFVGFDSYRKVIDSGIDMVILTTPPVFRPEHFKYATEKGVHCFLEKPVAVDPKGCRTVIATARQAKAKGLCVVTGTQRHHQRPYVEAFQKIQEGYIGEITGGNVYWNQGMLWYRERQAGWSDMEWMLRDWVNWKWLSGDHIVEQHVPSDRWLQQQCRRVYTGYQRLLEQLQPRDKGPERQCNLEIRRGCGKCGLQAAQSVCARTCGSGEPYPQG